MGTVPGRLMSRSLRLWRRTKVKWASQGWIPTLPTGKPLSPELALHKQGHLDSPYLDSLQNPQTVPGMWHFHPAHHCSGTTHMTNLTKYSTWVSPSLQFSSRNFLTKSLQKQRDSRVDYPCRRVSKGFHKALWGPCSLI